MGISEWRAERERREAIKKLQNEIAAYREVINRLNNIKKSYGDYSRQISEEIDNWDRAYQQYNDHDLTPDIQVTDSFEGVAAEQFSLLVPPLVETMVQSAALVAPVLPGIEDQITKIDEYIKKLEETIKSLQEQIAAM